MSSSYVAGILSCILISLAHTQYVNLDFFLDGTCDSVNLTQSTSFGIDTCWPSNFGPGSFQMNTTTILVFSSINCLQLEQIISLPPSGQCFQLLDIFPLGSIALRAGQELLPLSSGGYFEDRWSNEFCDPTNIPQRRAQFQGQCQTLETQSIFYDCNQLEAIRYNSADCGGTVIDQVAFGNASCGLGTNDFLGGSLVQYCFPENAAFSAQFALSLLSSFFCSIVLIL